MAEFNGPKVYGAVTVGERGQIVIPAQLRQSFGIKAGDKIFVMAKKGELIGLIPSDQFNEFLGHMTEMLAKFNKERPKHK